MKLERKSLRDSFNVHILPFRKYKFQPCNATGSQCTGSSRLEVTAERNRKRNAYIFQDFHAHYNRLRKSLKHYRDSPLTAEHRTGVQIKSRLQHNGTWAAAACPLRRLCYRPAVFIGHCAFSPVMKLRRPPTQSDIHQTFYWHDWFSWWWERGWSKHVEDWNKHIKKKRIVRQVGHLPELYRDARLIKHRIIQAYCHVFLLMLLNHAIHSVFTYYSVSQSRTNSRWTNLILCGILFQRHLLKFVGFWGVWKTFL
jgi:hypothetical protein